MWVSELEFNLKRKEWYKYQIELNHKRKEWYNDHKDWQDTIRCVAIEFNHADTEVQNDERRDCQKITGG